MIYFFKHLLLYKIIIDIYIFNILFSPINTEYCWGPVVCFFLLFCVNHYYRKKKTYSFLIDHFKEKKKNKGTKKCVVKKRLRHQNYKHCLLNKEIILKSQQRLKSEAHNVYTEEFNKIALRSNDDKRVWSSDGIRSYPYGYKGKHAKQSFLSKVNING